MKLSVNEIDSHVYAVADFTSCAATPNNEAEKNTYTYRFMLLAAGSCELELGGEHLNFAKHDLLFLLPGDSYRILNNRGDFTVRNIFFDFTQYRRNEDFPKTHRLNSSFDRSLCGERVDFSDTKIFAKSRLFTNMFALTGEFGDIGRAYYSHRTFSHKYTDVLMTKLLVSFASANEQTGGEKISSAHAIVDYIGRNCNLPLTAAELSQRFGYHPYHINRLVGELTGISLHDFVLRAKIKRASELLIETDMTVTELAQYLSFSDGSHFSKVFKRIAGCPPSEYRNK